MPRVASTEAVLTVDLPAIVANWKDLAARGAPGAVAGVVKADGYGLGAAEVGRALRAAATSSSRNCRKGSTCARRSGRDR